jgi:hypothetical protein
MADVVGVNDPGAVTNPNAIRSGLELADSYVPPAPVVEQEAKPRPRLGFLRVVDLVVLWAVGIAAVALVLRVALIALWASDRSGFVAWFGRITFPLVPLRGALPDLQLFEGSRIETDTLLTVGLYLGLWILLQQLLSRFIPPAEPPGPSTS